MEDGLSSWDLGCDLTRLCEPLGFLFQSYNADTHSSESGVRRVDSTTGVGGENQALGVYGATPLPDTLIVDWPCARARRCGGRGVDEESPRRIFCLVAFLQL